MSIRTDQAVAAGPSRNEAKGLLAAGGLIAGILSMSCCILPLALVTLGISGAWIGSLTALSPYQPLFVVASLALLGGGFWSVYWWPKVACAPGSLCASPRSDRIVKGVLWVATLMVVASVATNFVIPFFL